jgi:hypothetical protein
LLPEFIRRFLHSQVNPDADNSYEIDLAECPLFRSNVSVHHSARAVFYAPSDLSGNGGMREEIIRSTPDWYGNGERRDTVLVQYGAEDDIMSGLVVARVLCLLAFSHKAVRYPCALVEWFVPRSEPDPVTGMWILEPEIWESGHKRERALGLIHTDSIVRACHLIPVYGNDDIPLSLKPNQVHLHYTSFYLNKYADYHTHECYPTN